jgi:hypothetical protein
LNQKWFEHPNNQRANEEVQLVVEEELSLTWFNLLYSKKELFV